MRVTVPASSANLGPGFDTLGMALDLPFVLSSEPDDELLTMDSGHPARRAFTEAGGEGPLWWRSPIPPGRGLGFSGAARVAGAFMGYCMAGLDDSSARDSAFELAGRLEGHWDNAAASTFGGVMAAIPGRAVRVPIALDLQVVVWWPNSETSTNRSRATLRESVPLADCVHNIGHVAVLVAALASGDIDALRAATSDQLHQDARLALAPSSRAALEVLDESGPIAAWLSGSGPTVAAFARRGDGERLLSCLPHGGGARVLEIDSRGAVVVNR